MSMFKTSIAVLCFLTLASVCACEAGFDMQSTLVFLEKDSHAHTPEIVSTTQASLFYTFDFSIGTHSFLLEAGILIRKQRSTPFFRKLHYSFFTDTLFFSIGKNTFSFGEGSMKNYFFVHIPQEAGKKREATVWHSLLEIPVRQFLFSAGGFCDSDAPDNGALPKWYALWAKAVYSHPIVSAGIETDMVFQPERTEEQQKKPIPSPQRQKFQQCFRISLNCIPMRSCR
ncbi:MAG: hypothetical protein ACTTI3_02400 [Treponema sp.]